MSSQKFGQTLIDQIVGGPNEPNPSGLREMGIDRIRQNINSANVKCHRENNIEKQYKIRSD